MTKPKQICVLCGKRVATTKEHLPPKGIFAQPRPNDLIVVPACLKCNQGASKYDEIFRVYLSLHVGIDTPRTQALWEKHAYRTVRHNKRLNRNILNGMKEIEIRSETGIVLGKRQGVKWDSDVHDSVMNRIVRGLYFYHFGVILPIESFIKINWHRAMTKKIEQLSREWGRYSVANGDFQYRYGRVDEVQEKSIWLFQFYGKHWVSAHTNLTS